MASTCRAKNDKTGQSACSLRQKKHTKRRGSWHHRRAAAGGAHLAADLRGEARPQRRHLGLVRHEHRARRPRRTLAFRAASRRAPLQTAPPTLSRHRRTQPLLQGPAATPSHAGHMLPRGRTSIYIRCIKRTSAVRRAAPRKFSEHSSQKHNHHPSPTHLRHSHKQHI